MIDPIIAAWASDYGVVLSKEDSASHRRFFHISSDEDTFQVVIEPELNGFVRIDAHLIENRDDEQLHYMWEAPTERLGLILDLSAYSINNWFERGSDR
jgi:hypothetical protein